MRIDPLSEITSAVSHWSDCNRERGGRETGRSGADSEQRVYTAGEGFLGSRVMAIGGERVLLPDSQYGLSSHISSENKSLVFVKLTDSSFKAIEEYLRIKVRDRIVWSRTKKKKKKMK